MTGRVALGKGSRVTGSSRVRGPAIIGKNRILGPDAYQGPYISVGNDCLLKNVETENSTVMEGSRPECGKRIVDSLIGGYSTILNSDGAVPKGHRLIIGERSFAQI